MDKIRVIGGNALKGVIEVSGSKNSSLPIMASSLLTSKELRLSNVPHLMDISTMSGLLINHGVSFSLDSNDEKNGGGIISLKADNVNNFVAPYDIVRKMRASVLVLGPLLARFGEAKVSLPGGCAIGTRPINMHVESLVKMGAEIDLIDGYVHAKVKGRLQGTEIIFDKVSVGATENILMAASLAEGETILKNSAIEPEVTDLAECLVKMGAKIDGIGTSTIVINGVDELHGANHRVICDRIEAGTYMIAAAATGGDVIIRGADLSIMGKFIDKIRESGVIIDEVDGGVRVYRAGDISPIDIQTEPYPGFPTDMQAQMMAMMCVSNGASCVEENIFENRFMHVQELCRMGADISVSSGKAVIKGVSRLKGAQVMATDLRASVSLVIAALAAEGETIINRIYHIDRGYERIEEKLSMCGANIERVRGDESKVGG